jgi:type VI protein secretion system component VasF
MPAPTPAAAKPATLLDLVEPLFQYVCRLDRAAKRAGPAPAGAPGATSETVFFAKPAQGTAPSFAGRSLSMDYTVVRSEIKALLEDIQQKAAADIRLGAQARQIEMPLLFFIDSIISESKLGFAAQWNQNRLAYERNELAGDEKFFDLVEETLKDSSEDAAERLAVYYLCIGVGFTGIYFRQPEYLRKTMLAIAPRIRHMLDTEQQTRICPENYENIDTRNLVQPPSSKLVIVGILFLCFTVAALLSYVWIYRDASSTLSSALDKVLVQDPAKK